MALEAHVSTHGFMHLFLTQALSLGQSVLRTHSGLHPIYGSPWCSSMQLQTPSEQMAFEPHGEGLHLSTISASKN